VIEHQNIEKEKEAKDEGESVLERNTKATREFTPNKSPSINLTSHCSK